MPHIRQIDDPILAREIGLDAYLARLKARSEALSHLINFCNNGRRKSFYRLAAYLLELPSLTACTNAVRASGLSEVSDRAALAVKLLKGAAQAQNVVLNLRKKTT